MKSLKIPFLLIIFASLNILSAFGQVSNQQAQKSFSDMAMAEERKVLKLLEDLKGQGKYERKVVLSELNNFYSSYVEEQIISPTLKKDILKKIEKMNFRSNENTKQRAQAINELVFLPNKQCRKVNSSCSESLNQCCSGSFCSQATDLEDGKFFLASRCVKKLKLNDKCDPYANGCTEGTCKLIPVYTDINSCQSAGMKCESNGDCCSGTCDSKIKRCAPNYRCSSCVGVGNAVDTNSKNSCCEGLFPNEKGICEPIYPVTKASIKKNRISFKPLVYFVSLLISPAHASATKESIEAILNDESAGSLIQAMRDAKVPQGRITALMTAYRSKLDSCASGAASDRSSCYSNLSSHISSTMTGLRGISTKLKALDKRVEALKEEVSKMENRPDNDKIEGAIGSYYNKRNNCIDKYKTWNSPSNYEPAFDAFNNCFGQMEQIFSALNQSKNDLTAANMYLMSQFDEKGNAMGKEFFMQGKNFSDGSLYDDYEKDTPILGNISVSDMKSCRVNLFGDYLAKQSDDYFKVMMTLLGMDYVTSGLGIEDYFNVDHWALQTFGVEDDIEKFDSNIGKNNRTAQTFYNYGDAVKKEITSYYDTLNEEEKKIWKHLFYNSFVTPKDKKLILDYFIAMANGEDSTVKEEINLAKNALSGLDARDLPPPESYNLYRITRFESIKFKMYLYKLYGTLKRKSVEMMCRCVDTMGPMNGDEWLQPDVEKQYVKFCRGLGKYHLYVMADDQGCTKTDGNGVCIDAEHADFQKKVIGEEEKKYISENRQCAQYDENGNCLDEGSQTNFKNNRSDNVKDQITNSYSLNKISDLKITGERVSKADKFIKGSKVSFVAERGKGVSENFDAGNGDHQKNLADGDGLKFTAFLRDMAIMKVEALSTVASNNIFKISQSLELTSQFVSTFNWGYRKSDAQINTITKKYTWAQLAFRWLKQLIFGGGSSGGFSYAYFQDDINIDYRGNSALVKSRINESINSLSPRPYKICEKEKYKSSTWKVGKPGIPIGKKYYYRCVTYVKLANDICGSKLPVGMCIKSVYAANENGDVEFLLDAFTPQGVALEQGNRFIEGSTNRVYDLTDDHRRAIKDNAKKYLKTQVFDFGAWSAVGNGSDVQKFSEEEIDQFTNLVYEYHFIKPKKSYYIRYGTPGLVPYYKQLTSKAHYLNLAVLDDLMLTSAYAMKMHNFYYKVKGGLLNGVIMDQNQLDEYDVPAVKAKAPDVVGFLNQAHSQGLLKSGKLNFDANATGVITEGLRSSNDSVRDLAQSLNAISENEKSRRMKEKLMKNHLSKKGRSGDYDNMKKLVSKEQKSSDVLSRKFANSVRSIANNRMNGGIFDFSKSPRGRVAAYGSSKEDSSESGVDQMLKTVSSKSGSALKRQAKSQVKSKSKTEKSDDFSDFDLSDLEGDEIAGFTFGSGGAVIKKRAMVSYMANVEREEEKENKYKKNNPDWERDGTTIFKKLSRRYKRSAFPKFIQVKKK